MTLFRRAGNHDKVLGEFSVLHKRDALIPIFVKPKHEGSLECVAKAQGNPNIRPTVSDSHYLRVIGGSISISSISMIHLSENDWQRFFI